MNWNIDGWVNDAGCEDSDGQGKSSKEITGIEIKIVD